MKTIFVVFICLAFFAVSYGQNKLPTFETQKYAMMTKEKSCESINDYLRNYIGYPDECLKSKDEGTEVVKFTVMPNGELIDFEVVNSVSPVIDKHVIQMLEQTSGMWSPGLKDGKPAAMEKEVCIAFKYGEFEELAFCRDFKKKATAYFNRGNKLLLVKNRPEKALKSYNQAIKYCPNEDCLRVARGLCRYELGDIAGAHKDWQRLNFALISTETRELTKQMSDLKGYDEFAQILNKKEFPK